MSRGACRHSWGCYERNPPAWHVDGPAHCPIVKPSRTELRRHNQDRRRQSVPRSRVRFSNPVPERWSARVRGITKHVTFPIVTKGTCGRVKPANLRVFLRLRKRPSQKSQSGELSSQIALGVCSIRCASQQHSSRHRDTCAWPPWYGMTHA